MSHKIADALSFFVFLKIWAATISGLGDDDIESPQFEAATLFPPKDLSGYVPDFGITKENIITKRYAFDASMIETLKSKIC